MPASFGENGNCAFWRDSGSSGTIGMSCCAIGAQAPPESGMKQPAMRATVVPSSPPSKKPSPSTSI